MKRYLIRSICNYLLNFFIRILKIKKIALKWNLIKKE